MAKLINIGFGNVVNSQKIVAVVNPDAAPVKRMVQSCLLYTSGSFGKGTEHDGTVGDGFVAWNCKFSVEICKFFYFHNNRSLNIKFHTAKQVSTILLIKN